MREQIINLIMQVTGDETVGTRLTDSSNLVEDVPLDSLQMINLVLLIENEFNVEVNFETFDIDHLRSFDKFVGYIKELETV